ncbi:MAG: DUF3298 and DUF4163 domain-containing protein [Acetatifactor sp.]|nr:DUF3298 and DUF4163 domain-containing protein [Acetatifactor sp.]
MKKKYVCLLAGLVAVMLAGCGAKEAEPSAAQSTQESVVASTTESSAASSEVVESSESKADIIGAGPDYVVLSHKDSVSYWSDEEEDLVDAQYAKASELVILSPGYDKLKAAIAEHNAAALEGMEQAFYAVYDFLDSEEDYSFAYFPWESTTDMYVTRSDAQLFSYITNFYEYMGGAHGYYYSRAYNYDPATGRELKLSDLVTDMSKLHELVVAQIKDEWDTDELFEEWEDTVDEAFNYPDGLNFLAGPDTICIWFDTYELAPYVCGEIQTIFAMEDCDGLFNETYFHAENAEVAPGKVVLGTDMFQKVVQTLANQIGVMKFYDVKALLDREGYTYEEAMLGAEVDGAFILRDPENGAEVRIFFWPVDIEEDEDYEDPDKYFVECVRYEIGEDLCGWVGQKLFGGDVEYIAIDENYEQYYFETVEEMTSYLFY